MSCTLLILTVVPTQRSASGDPRNRSARQRPLMLCGKCVPTPFLRNAAAAALKCRRSLTGWPRNQTVTGTPPLALPGSVDQLL